MISKYTVTIQNIDNVLIGYITINNHPATSQPIPMNNINFNPLTILADLDYISRNLSFEYTSETLFLFPYTEEPCLNLPIIDKHTYFCLLDELKQIIYHDTKIDIIQLYRLSSFYRLRHSFQLYFQNSIPDDGMILYEPSSLITNNDIIKSDLENTNHFYISYCDSISEIIFSIFNYLINMDYHFFQCQHCKKYSAIKRNQGNDKYCSRPCLLDKYNNFSCNLGVKKMLDKIRTRKQSIIKYHQNYGTEDSLNSFLKQYDELNDKVKNDPSEYNLTNLYNFIDKNSIRNLKKSTL